MKDGMCSEAAGWSGAATTTLPFRVAVREPIQELVQELVQDLVQDLVQGLETVRRTHPSIAGQGEFD